MADAADSKSAEATPRESSSLSTGTCKYWLYEAKTQEDRASTGSSAHV